MLLFNCLLLRICIAILSNKLCQCTFSILAMKNDIFPQLYCVQLTVYFLHFCCLLRLQISDTSPFHGKGFFVNNASFFAMHEILPNGGQQHIYTYKYIPRNNIDSFALDSKLDNIYFVDRESSSLKKYNIRSEQLSTLDSVSPSRGKVYFCRSNKTSSNFLNFKQSLHIIYDKPLCDSCDKDLEVSHVQICFIQI